LCGLWFVFLLVWGVGGGVSCGWGGGFFSLIGKKKINFRRDISYKTGKNKKEKVWARLQTGFLTGG